MGFVKAIPGKFGHQVKNILCFIFGMIVPESAGHKLGLLVFHHLWNFFTHSPAEYVCITKGVTCKDIGDLHHLFLVDNNTVGFFQDWFNICQRVVGRGSAMFSLNKVINHPGIQGAGTIQGNQGDEVAELLRSHFYQQFSHPRTLQLEDTQSISPTKQIVGLSVIHRNGINIQIRTYILFDMFDCLVNDSEGFQAEKIEFN